MNSLTMTSSVHLNAKAGASQNLLRDDLITATAVCFLLDSQPAMLLLEEVLLHTSQTLKMQPVFAADGLPTHVPYDIPVQPEMSH